MQTFDALEHEFLFFISKNKVVINEKIQFLEALKVSFPHAIYFQFLWLFHPFQLQ